VAGRLTSLLGGWRHHPPLRRRWTELAAGAAGMAPAERRALAEEARRLRGDLDLFLMAARRSVGDPPLPLPPGTDWSWRPLPFCASLPGRGLAAPAAGAGLGPGISVWHDLPGAPLVVAQHPGPQGDDLPAFSLHLESFALAGQGYAALSFALPQEALAGLDTSFILQVATVSAVEAPATTYLRLNVEHGPDTERVLRDLGSAAPGEAMRAETGFDLGFVPMNPRRLAKIWLDVIVEKPGANALRLHDLVISRHRRADV